MQDNNDNLNDEKITVEVYNGKVSLNKEDRDPLYISSLAKFVNEKINEIAHKLHNADTSRLGILAALDITDELFKLKEKSNINTEQIDSQILELIALIDGTMSD